VLALVVEVIVRDARLLKLARLGDEAAFAQLVQRHRRLLLAHCRSIVGDGAAQDALQHALISAWHALRGGCEVRNARAWLFTISHRSSLQLLRAQHEPAAELSLALVGASSPHELLERRAQLRATLAAVAELPPHERDALLLTTVHGRSGRDAARALGVSEPQVRQLVFRARGRAREALAGSRASLGVFGLLPHWVRGLRRATRGVAGGCRFASQRATARVSSAHLGGHWGAAALTAAVAVAVPPIVAGVASAPASRPVAKAGWPTGGVERQPAAVIAPTATGSRGGTVVRRLAATRQGGLVGSERPAPAPAQSEGAPPALPTSAATPRAQGIASAPVRRLASTAATPHVDLLGSGPARQLPVATGAVGALLKPVTAPVLQTASALTSDASSALSTAEAPVPEVGQLAAAVPARVGEAAGKVAPAVGALRVAP
jgi:RNA polymerase sigma factor (sigma-70 family)